MKELIELIKHKANDQTFSGVVSIFKQNHAIYNEAFGYRDINNQLLNQTNTKFGIASGTKIFTALGIGKLIDNHLLKLSTKVSEIDQAFMGFIDQNATILHLLTHTSGVYDYLDEETMTDYDNFSVEIPWYKLETPSDYLPLFKGKHMKYSANERYSYSNGGYVLLGIIIERLTKQHYRDFITETILKPVGMLDSGFYAFNQLPSNTAFGYLEDRETTNIYRIPIRGGGDGGMYTTTYDLNTFWHAFLNNKILSESLTQEYLKTHITFNERFGYGCGVYKGLKNPSYSIVGGDAGVGFDSRFIIQDELVINIISNISDGEEEMIRVILDYLYVNK